MGKTIIALLCLCMFGARAERTSDLVTSIPGFDGDMPSRVFSGYLRASAAGQTFQTHYVLTESQRAPASDPLVLWQQGGPGSSGLGYGYLTEWGPYRLTADSLTENTTTTPKVFLNPNSWDQIANMLVFEHPPGTGFSFCEDGDGNVTTCDWNDQTQAEAFEATFEAFYDAFPSFAQSTLQITGESYAGLLVPFLVSRLVDNQSSIAAKQLVGTALGNGCPGSSGSSPDARGTCNGPYGSYDTEHIVDLVYGHGGVSKPLYEQVVTACGFPCDAKEWTIDECASDERSSHNCSIALSAFDDAAGYFDIYNFYDNCGSGNAATRDARSAVTRRKRLDQVDGDGADDSTAPHTGGESYPCGTGAAANAWVNDPSVRTALHMKDEDFYGRPWPGNHMNYTTCEFTPSYVHALYSCYRRPSGTFEFRPFQPFRLSSPFLTLHGSHLVVHNPRPCLHLQSIRW